MWKDHLLPFNPIANALSVLQGKGRQAQQQQLLASMKNPGLDPAGTLRDPAVQGRGWPAQKEPLLQRFSLQGNSDVTTWEFSI